MERSVAAALAVVILALFGCAGGDRTEATDSSAGTVVLRRSDGGQLLSARAHAWYCPEDSSLAIAAVGGGWSAAIALRSPWPPTDSVFGLGALLGATGSAALALRPIPRRDSVGVAMRSRRGSVTIRSSGPLAGRLDGLVSSDAGDSMHVSGSLEGLVVDTNGCAQAAALPTRPRS
jgi:hypothetical protein